MRKQRTPTITHLLGCFSAFLIDLKHHPSSISRFAQFFLSFSLFLFSARNKTKTKKKKYENVPVAALLSLRRADVYEHTRKKAPRNCSRFRSRAFGAKNNMRAVYIRVSYLCVSLGNANALKIQNGPFARRLFSENQRKGRERRDLCATKEYWDNRNRQFIIRFKVKSN